MKLIILFIIILFLQISFQCYRSKKRRVNHTPRKITPRRRRISHSRFMRHHQITRVLSIAANRCSSFCSVKSIGYTYERRRIKILEIAKRKSNPYIWIDAGIHAREWIAPAAAMYLVDQLTMNYGLSHDTTNLLNRWNIYIAPVLNPDGYEYSHRTKRMWRKNRRRGKICHGVDLNRNFGYKYGGKGTSTDTCSNIYKGPRAFSELESMALRNFLLPRVRQLRLYLTLHSFGQYILVPYGYEINKYPPNYNDMLRKAKVMGMVMNRTGTEFIVGHTANTYYPAAGGSDDWARAIGIPFSYTVELPDKGRHGFRLPASEILPVGRQLLAGIKALLGEIQKS